MVLLFVNQNASVLESNGSRDYKKHSCRYIGHSCKQLLELALFASLLHQKITLHSVRESRSGPQSSANQSNTTLLGRVRENAHPAVFSAGWKVRRAEYLGRDRSMQMWEGEFIPPRTIKEPVCCHCNITYKTQAQCLMSLSLKIRETFLASAYLLCAQNVLFSFQKLFILKWVFANRSETELCETAWQKSKAACHSTLISHGRRYCLALQNLYSQIYNCK